MSGLTELGYWEKGFRIGDYEILSRLGEGGMGVVYEARNCLSDELVALKTVKVSNEGMLQRIRREIRVLARIEHPGIVRILDEGVYHGIPWFAMEYISGLNLRKHIQQICGERRDSMNFETRTSDLIEQISAAQSGLDRAVAPGRSNLSSSESYAETSEFEVPGEFNDEAASDERTEPPDFAHLLTSTQLNEILQLSLNLAKTLTYLHGQGLVHCDLKPENIFLRTATEPIIVDFGLTVRFHYQENREALLLNDGAAGTITYMAPEQIRGDYVDARADLYSLGCILYELFLGFPPFQGKVSSIVLSHLHKQPKAPKSIDTSIPDILNDLIMSLLEKEAYRRIGYADSVVSALGKLLSDEKAATSKFVVKPYLYRSHFTGRRKILKELREYREQLFKNSGITLLIKGEQGMGKTRLLVEIGRNWRKSDLFIFTGSNREHNARPLECFLTPLLEIVDWCRNQNDGKIAEIFNEKVAPLALFQPAIREFLEDKQLVDQSLPHDMAQLNIFRALIHIFQSLSAIKPIVLVLDDLQWLDSLTRSFFSYLFRTSPLRNNPVLIIGALRTQMNQGDNFFDGNVDATIHLTQLSEKNVSIMLADMLASNESASRLTTLLYSRTGGNPFFIAEYLRGAMEKGFLKRNRKGQWFLEEGLFKDIHKSDTLILPIPQTLQELILRRLNLLSVEETAVLQVIALMDRETRFRELCEILDVTDEQLLDNSGVLLNRKLLTRRRGDTFALANTTLRAILIHHLPTDERQKLHTRIAGALLSVEDSDYLSYAAELAYHFEKAGEDIEAMHWYYHASNEAGLRYALELAEKYMKRSLKLSKHIDRIVISRMIEYGVSILQIAGKLHKAGQVLEKALKESQLSGDENLILEAKRSLAIVLSTLGKKEKARSLLKEAFEQAEIRKDHRVQAFALHHLATIALDQGDSVDALRLFKASLMLSRQLGRKLLEASILGNMAGLIASTGDLEEAISYDKKALEIAISLNEKRLEGLSLGRIASHYFHQGKILKSLELLEKACAIGRQVGDRRFTGQAILNIASVLGHLNRKENMDDAYQEALAISREVGDKQFEGWALTNIATLMSNQGKYKEALTLYEKSMELFDEIGDKRSAGRTLTNIASMYQEQEDYKKALETNAEAYQLSIKTGDRQFQALNLVNKADMLIDDARIDEALVVLVSADQTAALIQHTRLQGEILMTKAQIARLAFGDIAMANTYLDRLKELLKDGDLERLYVQVLCELGHCALAQAISAEDFLVEAHINVTDPETVASHMVRKAIQTLEESQKAFIEGEKLYHGQKNETVPKGIRKWLRKKKESS